MFRIYFTSIIIFLSVHVAVSQKSIDGWNVYFGSFHNHSALSNDATGNPAFAFIYARDSSKLDFLGLAEHCIYLDKEKWATLKSVADFSNHDSVFTTFAGFEWTATHTYGHICILHTKEYATYSDSLTNSFQEISDWIKANNGIAFFNHPGRENQINAEFNHFDSEPIPNFVGMELWNKNVGFSNYYQNDGYDTTDNGKNFYNEALLKGWRIGAAGGEDNHWASWGNYSNFRIGVLAKANTRENIYDALLNRRFYSTLDKNLLLSFRINKSQMGDSVEAGTNFITIKATDLDYEIFNRVVLMKNGDTLKIWDNQKQNLSITDSLVCDSGDYFYVIVNQQDGDQAISSPIFVGKKENAPPMGSELGTKIVISANNIHIENISNEIIDFQIIDFMGKIIKTGVLEGYDNIQLYLQKNETIKYLKVYNNKDFKVYEIVY